MHLYLSVFSILVVFSYTSNVWAIPLENLNEDGELVSGFSNSDNLANNIVPEEEKQRLSPQNDAFSNLMVNKSLIQDDSQNDRNTTAEVVKDKQVTGGGYETDFYLFEQDERDAQQEGLDIYRTLAPMLSPEAKKQAKKLWENSADFRAAIKLSDKDSETQALVLTKSSVELSEYKGQSSEEIAIKNLPPRLTEAKDPDKEVVHELFVRLYELLKRALLIIVTALVLGKLISFVIKKLLSRRKKRHSRRSSRRHTRTQLEASRKHRRRRRRSATI